MGREFSRPDFFRYLIAYPILLNLPGALLGWYLYLNPPCPPVHGGYGYLFGWRGMQGYAIAAVLLTMLGAALCDRVNLLKALRFFALISKSRKLAKMLGCELHVVRISYDKVPK